MNKLKGEHEIKMDADEIALIFQSDKLDNLAELIAKERDDLLMIIQRHQDNFTPQEIQQLGDIVTKNKCPSCGYEW